MNKKLIVIVGVVIGLLVIGGGVLAYTNNQNDKKEAEKMAMEKTAMAKEEDAAMMQKEKDAKAKEDSMMKDNAMSTNGTYVTLADYKKDTDKYADSKKIYFFHASWCPICQSIEKEINADMSKLPKDTTLIKTDFDSETDLRKKYGVTTQYTFVQVDNDGNETAQWSASSLDDAVAGIKS